MEPTPANSAILPFLSLLGLYVSGDVGQFSIYTTKRGRVVIYPKSPPKKPPTYLQLQQRLRFKHAQALWTALSPPLRNAWEDAVRKIGVDLTGQNALISLSLSPDADAFARLNKAAGGILTMPIATPR